ncbi:DUF58 domain-containing protein [Chitinophaga costaii]|nr:DUF58 domain-containing protein [Chitinophaga costaii]
MAIKDLSLFAKTVIDGFMTGINKSASKGTGLEFSQYRSYQPGDDLRWLDWKMYGRSDRYYIRESEVETSISVRFIVDASQSMEHNDNGYTKMDYARHLCAALGYLAHKQGDAIGLYGLTEKGVHVLATRRDAQHLQRFYYQLENLQPGGQFTAPGYYKNIFATTSHKELVIIVTDFYEREGEIGQLLKELSAYRHEIILFQVMGRNELELDYGQYSSLQDLETGETVNIHAGQVRGLYLERLKTWLAAIRQQMLEQGISYRLLRMDAPMDQALRDFLNQRQKMSI